LASPQVFGRCSPHIVENFNGYASKKHLEIEGFKELFTPPRGNMNCRETAAYAGLERSEGWGVVNREL
jgi:hypothetical protein